MKPPSQAPGAETRKGQVVELSRFRAEIGRGRRIRRADALLAAADPAAAVRALPGDEFYYVIHELGFPDAQEVLQHGTPAQVQTALDFSLWDRDRLATAAADEWLGAMIEAPIEALGAWARGLDIELLALLLRQRARIYDLSLEEPPEEPEGSFWPSPDNLFVLDLLGDDHARWVTERLLDRLYRFDRLWVRRVLVGTRGDLDAELEEHAYRWRSGRMADLGFEDYYAALEVYREIDPASVQVGGAPAPRVRPLGDEAEAAFLRVPSGLAERLSGESLFARAAAGIEAREELDNLKASLVMLSNRVLAADRVTPGDDEAAEAVLARMAATLDLAVELCARGRLEEGTRAVRSVPLVRLFQLGVTLVGKVRALALTLTRKSPLSALLEPDDAEVLAAVTQVRPRFPRLLDQPPAGGDRPFGSLADVATATAVVERAGAALTLLHLLGLRPEHLEPPALAALGVAEIEALDAGLVARTLLARRWVEGGPTPLAALDARQAAKLEDLLREAGQDAGKKAQIALLLRDETGRLWPGGTPSPGALAIADRSIAGLLAGEPVLAAATRV